MTLLTGTRLTLTGGGAQQTGIKTDISDAIDEIDVTDTPLLSILGWANEAGAAGGADTLRFPCIQPKHQWLNDALVPASGAVNGVLDTSSATIGVTRHITVASDTGEYYDIDDVLMINEGVYIVTDARTSHTADLLAVKVLKAAAGAMAAATTPIYNLGKASTEAVLASNFTFGSTSLGTDFNACQIFTDVVAMSGTAEATEMYGMPDPFQYQLDKKWKELIVRLEQAAHYGFRNHITTTATFPLTIGSDTSLNRRFGGLYDFVRYHGSTSLNLVNGASGALTEKMLNDLLQLLWAQGGHPDTILVGPWQKRVISQWITPNVRVQRTDRVAGVIVGQYESEFGTIDIVLDRYVHPADLICIQKEFLGIGPLRGNGQSRAFTYEVLPKLGDLQSGEILGEYTMEVRNATKAHGWIYSLATS